MKRQPANPRSPEKTKAVILAAAVREFGDMGLEGARMSAIARRAGVNKALIHYYFEDKQSLYGATLDLVFAGLAERMRAVLDREQPPREAVLAFAGAHFDYLASNPMFPRLVQREMMRAGRGPSPHIRRIVRRYLRPVQQRLVQVLLRGMESGELRRVNPFHFVFSMVAMNVFYFAGAQVVGMISGKDPLQPEQIAERKAAVLDVVAAALFAPGRSHSRPRKIARRKAKS
ncbi:MAG TPA: TetR/AcrR family transcriptional regulator [Terriglobales bacterium]|nr:TetR/AcrR family transcriptional regulator [Terriglobales bacterium]